MKNRIICICNFVSEQEILNLLKKGLSSSEEIKEITRAGSTCGRCLPEIEALVENYQPTVKAATSFQQRLNFK